MQGYSFLARDFLCFLNRTFNTVRDKVKLGLAFFYRFAGLRLQDNHRPVGCGSVREYPAILAVNHIEASAPHNYRTILVERIAYHFIEMFPPAAKPGEYLRNV